MTIKNNINVSHLIYKVSLSEDVAAKKKISEQI